MERIWRIAMPVMFLVATGALVYGVLTLLRRQPQAAENRAANISGAESRQAPASGTRQEPQAGLSEAALANSPQLPEGLEPVSPWAEAEAALEKFLAASTLDGRLPFMETRTPQPELAASCLAKPLPNVRRLVPEFRETNPIERVVDCYYSVQFEHADPTLATYTMLVRSRGSSAPRVVVDPFLDTFGGRLAAYAATPVDKAGVFQVVVYAVASCIDPGIPYREKKLTLKLLPSDNAKEIARAYFGRQSKIAEMLEDETYSLNYGSAKACTVMLRWNTEDDPHQPFLEAIAIKELDWNS